MSISSKLPTAATASSAKLDLFLNRLAAQKPTGRLVFALDATMSRQPTWDRACQLQAEMFSEAAGIGGLEIQVVYFRGKQELSASPWMTNAKQLEKAMTGIVCKGGYTQIARVLSHAQREHDKAPIAAVVFVGDASEESIETLSLAAQKLSARGIKVFMFLEGDDEEAEKAFREISHVTKGACCKFSSESARELGDLLRAVAAYASGGLQALSKLEAQGKPGAIELLGQIK
jgi:hypothetical protein